MGGKRDGERIAIAGELPREMRFDGETYRLEHR
jgi:hypothetical protein